MEDIQFEQTYSGVEIYYSIQCESTQFLCKKLIDNKIKSENGFWDEKKTIALYSFHQTKGVGQNTNKWFCEPHKNLAVTLAFNISEDWNLIDLNKKVTLTILKSIQSFTTKKVFVKWPNDIYVENKKIAGILFEIQSLNHQKIGFLGIGININQTVWNDQLTNAISLCELNNQIISKSEVFQNLVQNLNSILLDKTKLNQIQFNNSLWNVNQEITLKIMNGKELKFVNCVLLGVDEQGRILVNYNDEVLRFHHGQASIFVG